MKLLNNKIECIRCGACCYVDLTAYIVDEDIIRWKRENRYDILEKLEQNSFVWAGDRLISVRNDNKRNLRKCSFLIKNNDGLYACSIYETRPLVCQNFEPGKSYMCPQYFNVKGVK